MSAEVALGRLHVLRVDPHVPNVRVRKHHKLALVRRVGQDLLVPGHRRVEHTLPHRRPSVSKRRPVPHGPVLEHKPAV